MPAYETRIWKSGWRKNVNEDEIEIVATIKLPLPFGAFIGTMKGLQDDFDETLYIRNCIEGYEVFRCVKSEKV